MISVCETVEVVSASTDSHLKSCFNLQTPIRAMTAAVKRVARMTRVTLSDLTFDPPADGACGWESVENAALIQFVSNHLSGK